MVDVFLPSQETEDERFTRFRNLAETSKVDYEQG